MKVDFHFHLEEGPYSFGWLQRTAGALEASAALDETIPRPKRNSFAWISDMTDRLKRRLDDGAFSEHWLRQYLRFGERRGIRQFGVVDHLYRFREFRAYYEKFVLTDDSELGRKQRDWLDRVCVGSIEDFLRAARSVQRQEIPLSVGIEADYFPGGEEELKDLLSRHEFDYVIGSVHFLDGWGFDNPDTMELFRHQDLIGLYRKLFDHVMRAARSGLFDIVAHLDNLKVFGYRPDEVDLFAMYDEVAAALKAADVATEINTGLAYRYPVKEMCPSPALLGFLHKHGVPITLSSDAHFPDDIGTLLDEAIELAKQTGYQEIAGFRNRQRYSIPLHD